MSTVFGGSNAMSLGGFLCVRGYATLRDIARCSFADRAYQRELKPEHRDEIIRYIEAGDYLFFPEIVLSTTLDVDYEKDGAPSTDPLQGLIKGRKFRSNVNDLRVNTFTSRFDVVVPDGLRPFKRIDGNHRLSAIEALNDDRFDRYLAPFCIILFDSKNAVQNEKALFHNINSKARPLTSEESFKGIIDDEAGFSDDELEAQFGPEYLQCRALCTRLNFDYLINLKPVFGKLAGSAECHRSILILSLQDIAGQFSRLNIGPLPDTDAVFDAIRAVNDIYADARLSECKAQGMFAAFLFWQLNPNANDGQINQFTNWVLRTHQYELETINTADLIKIFEKVAMSHKLQQTAVSISSSIAMNSVLSLRLSRSSASKSSPRLADLKCSSCMARLKLTSMDCS